MYVIQAPPPLPARPRDANKVTVGRVLVVGGSRDMVGAPALAGLGALRAGAGLVRIAVPRSIQPTVAGFTMEATSAGLEEDVAGELGAACLDDLREMAGAWDAVVLGPGLGRSVGTVAAVRTFSLAVSLPLVLDADALFAWNERLPDLRERPAPTVLTPHEGEAARLLGVSSDEVRANRQVAAAQIATESGSVCVLKGPGTLVTDGDGVYVNPTGGPLLATGGSGDVLSGALGALLAQATSEEGTAPLPAACLAVHAHGAAADLCAQGRDRGMLASDIAAHLPDALRDLGGGERP